MANVAFLGTGLLGSGMVERMLRGGETVTVWNRTDAKARALERLGATVAASPADAVASADRGGALVLAAALVAATGCLVATAIRRRRRFRPA